MASHGDANAVSAEIPHDRQRRSLLRIEHNPGSTPVSVLGFAEDHPGQYASTLLVPAERDEELLAAQEAIVSVIARVLQSCGLSTHEAAHHARVVRSTIHGFVALEATDSFTGELKVDDSYERLIEFVIRGLPRAEPSS